MKLHQNAYDLKRPCENCPFRNDRPFYLAPGRVENIRSETDVRPFTCHKTVDYEGKQSASRQRQHCAGALILRQKLGRPSLVARLAHQLQLYDPAELDMESPVYDTWDEMAESTGKL